MIPMLSTRVALLLSPLFAMSVVRASAQDPTMEAYVPGRLLVGVDAAIRPPERTIADLRADPAVCDVRRLFKDTVWLVELDSTGTDDSTAEKLRGVAGVDYVEHDWLVYPSDVPNDPQYANQWGFGKVAAPMGWTIQRYAQNVVVAVIDTGVMYSHPDLAANMWTNPGEIPNNGIDDDANGYVDDIHGYDFVHGNGNPDDDYFHGTHVAGTIGAATNNAVGVSGMCWSVKIMALKFIDVVSGSGATSDAILCIAYAYNNGARVTNNSWRGYGFSQALYNVMDSTGNADMLHVCAAGNEAINNDATPAYPASFDLPEVLAVAACDSSDHMASFSNYGSVAVDIAAPGVGILSTYNNGAYDYLDGTSMACPHVAGAVCLMVAHCASLTTQQIKDVLLNTADVLPAYLGQVSSSGRLNIEHALLQACAVPNVYCTPGTTTNHCNAMIASSGSPSVSIGSGFTISVSQVEGQRSGILFYGILGQAAIPWATGSTSFMCVKVPTQRMTVQNSGGSLFNCNGSFNVNFFAFMSANPNALGQPLSVGSRYNVQAWFRDPPAPKTTNLSDALEFPLIP